MTSLYWRMDPLKLIELAGEESAVREIVTTPTTYASVARSSMLFIIIHLLMEEYGMYWRVLWGCLSYSSLSLSRIHSSSSNNSSCLDWLFFSSDRGVNQSHFITISSHCLMWKEVMHLPSPPFPFLLPLSITSNRLFLFRYDIERGR